MEGLSGERRVPFGPTPRRRTRSWRAATLMLSCVCCLRQLIESLLAFIKANPAKSKEWKEVADSKIAEQDA